MQTNVPFAPFLVPCVCAEPEEVPWRPPAELLAGRSCVGQTVQALLSPRLAPPCRHRGTAEGDDRSRQFQNTLLRLSFPWQGEPRVPSRSVECMHFMNEKQQLLQP